MIRKIKIDSEIYPELLRKINNPPQELYCIGNLKIDKPCIAVVGTRKYSLYGKQTTLEIANNLAGNGIIIVSGLAPGIDTFAHSAAVERNQKTIAVLGTGLDKKSIYPKENIELAEKIIKTGGCLISEYAPGTRGTRFTFPERNRIVSGLSQAVLVIEAKKKSGALITANYAFAQKRKVFALPGSIYSLNSQGTHNLIKKGAKLIENADDILKELNLNTLYLKKDSSSENIEQTLILNALEEQALHIDKIIEKTKLNPGLTASTLTILEINGKIRNLGGNIYSLLN